jgi:hypothetical protein
MADHLVAYDLEWEEVNASYGEAAVR